MEAFTQFGKYQILDRIAFGGMAELFRARIQGDQGFQKLVAVKKMHAHFSIEPEVVEAFIEEAKLAAFLQHPISSRSTISVAGMTPILSSWSICRARIYGP
jgi:serine/threonine protein kinase